jgi:predicted transcriptional regulator
MWLLGSTDVKILTRTHSVRTQGTGMKKGSSSWWRPMPHIYGETRCGKKSERCSCTSWSSTVLLQTYDSINLPCTHRSSWFDKRRSKKNYDSSGIRLYACITYSCNRILHWLISCLDLETSYLVSSIHGFSQSLQPSSKLVPQITQRTHPSTSLWIY